MNLAGAAFLLSGIVFGVVYHLVLFPMGLGICTAIAEFVNTYEKKVSNRIKLLHKLQESVRLLEGCSNRNLNVWAKLNQQEVLRSMNNLMLEVCEPVFDLQEQSVKTNPLDWRPKHAELMKVVTVRFDALKIFGYMPQGGYGLFFQHIRYLRDGEPEKCILAT